MDPSFAAAVEAIHAGDVAGLGALLDAEPRLLAERMIDPDVYRIAGDSGYFRDPKLFWYIANNPILVQHMPANIVEIAQTMIDRGVDKADLDYALELTMTGSAAREAGLQRPLIHALLDAGAQASRNAVIVTAGHCERDALVALVDAGYELNVPVAAALGDENFLRAAIASAGAGDVQTAFALAVINEHVECARMALDAGAAIDAYLPVHAHSTALHQAALTDNVPLIEFLLGRGARSDVLDTLWGGTALDWSIHENRPAARAVLERAG